MTIGEIRDALAWADGLCADLRTREEDGSSWYGSGWTLAEAEEEAEYWANLLDARLSA